MHLNWLKPESEEQSIWLIRYIRNRYGDLDRALSMHKIVPKEYVKRFKAIAPTRWTDEEVRKARYRKMYDAWTSKKRRSQKKEIGSDLRITLSQKDKKRFVSLSKKRNLTQSELVVFLLDAYGSMQSEMEAMSDELNRKIETREFEIEKHRADIKSLREQLHHKNAKDDDATLSTQTSDNL
ncbi:TPA: hypothetical protein RQL15_002080 [Vibrio vulnificus]|nr:hypothetical protein [Vibrio vulnificus]